jgi:hypothetical protein
VSRPSYDREALRRRGRELAAAAPPLTPEQREQLRAILRDCPLAPEHASGPAGNRAGGGELDRGGGLDAERTPAA